MAARRGGWAPWIRVTAVAVGVLAGACSQSEGPNTANVDGPFDWTFVFDEDNLAPLPEDARTGRWYAQVRLDRSTNPDPRPACLGDQVYTIVGDATVFPSRMTGTTSRSGHLNGTWQTGRCPGIRMTLSLDRGERITLSDNPAAEPIPGVTALRGQTTDSLYFAWEPDSGKAIDPYRGIARDPAATAGPGVVVAGSWRRENEATGGAFFVRPATLSYRPDRFVTVDVDNVTGDPILGIGSFQVESNVAAQLNSEVWPAEIRRTTQLRRIDSLPGRGSVPYQFAAKTRDQEAFTQEGECFLTADSPDRIRVTVLSDSIRCDIGWYVPPVQPHFELTPVPDPLVLAQGQTDTVTIFLNRFAGFAEPVQLSLIDGGATGIEIGRLAPTAIPSGSGQATLPFTALVGARPGRYSFRVQGASPSQIVRTTLAIEVLAPAASFDLTVSPASLVIEPGTTGTVELSVARAGYDGNIAISAEAAPLIATPRPAVIASGSDRGLIDLAVPGGLAGGTYAVVVSADGGATHRTAVLTVTVPRSPGFALNTTPASITLTPFETASIAIELTRTGYQGPVGLSYQPGALGAITAGPVPTAIPAAAGGTTLNLQIDGTAAAGYYPITITGTGGGATTSTTLELTVGTFDFTLTPSQLTLAPGDGGIIHLDVTRDHLTRPIALSYLTIGGATIVAEPDPIPTGATRTTLTVRLPAPFGSGTHSMSVRATAGGLVRTKAFTVVVP